jgi:aminoacrylate hydrolase
LFLYPPYWFYGKDQAALDADAAGHLAHFPAPETMHKRIDALAAFDVVDRLNQITCPTLLIAAYDDLLVPWQCTARLHQGLPNSDYAYMLAGAHACNVTDPERFEEIVLLWLAGEPITEE